MKEDRYAEAGVDIDAKASALARAKETIRSTFTAGVLGDVGGFGGLFRPDFSAYREPVLVASTDGVGTKLKVAVAAGRHDGCGADLVNHCVNDILVQGARPLFFLDYIAAGKIEPEVLQAVIEGIARGCRENGTALLGGETAEMPGFYAPGDYDVAGTIVGVVEREKILDGSRVRAGDLVLGLPSAGLHTNGYTLARQVFFEKLGKKPGDRMRELGSQTVGDALLAPHLSYLKALEPLLAEDLVHAMAHITGGGFYDNIPRVLPEGVDVRPPTRIVAHPSGLRGRRARRGCLLRGDAPRLQHGHRHGGLRRPGRPAAHREDLVGRGTALVLDRKRAPGNAASLHPGGAGLMVTLPSRTLRKTSLAAAIRD